MLVIKVELWPYGKEAEARELGRMQIGNVGGTDSKGNYVVNVSESLTHEAREGRIYAHSRLSAPVWTLVAKAIRSVGLDR